MRTLIKIIGAVLLAVLLAGCSGGGEPTETPLGNETQFHGPLDPQYDDGMVHGDVDSVPMLQPFVYDDKLQVQITKLQTKTATAEDAEYSTDIEAGQEYTVFSLKVTNNSPNAIEIASMPAAYYGPDGTDAVQFDSDEVDALKILPGRSKSGTYSYIIPTEHRGDVIFQYTPNFEHGPAIFTGSVK